MNVQMALARQKVPYNGLPGYIYEAESRLWAIPGCIGFWQRYCRCFLAATPFAGDRALAFVVNILLLMGFVLSNSKRMLTNLFDSTILLESSSAVSDWKNPGARIQPLVRAFGSLQKFREPAAR